MSAPPLSSVSTPGWGRGGAGAEGSRLVCRAPLAAGERSGVGSAYPRCVLTGLGSFGVYCVAFPNAGGDVSEAKVLLKYVDR